MIAEIIRAAFLVLATMFSAASLGSLLGLSGESNVQPGLAATGFALLAVCFAWLWLI